MKLGIRRSLISLRSCPYVLVRDSCNDSDRDSDAHIHVSEEHLITITAWGESHGMQGIFGQKGMPETPRR